MRGGSRRGGGSSLLVCTIVLRALPLVAFFCGGVVASPQATRMQAHGPESGQYCCVASEYFTRASLASLPRLYYTFGGVGEGRSAGDFARASVHENETK